jgi:hypothetical protein
MQLTDTQSKLLHAAALHPEHLLTDFPANLKGGARLKVLTALQNSGCIHPMGQTDDGAIRFAITAAGFEALGLQAPQPVSAPPTAPTTPVASPAATPVTREGTKQAALIGLLRRPEGATLGQMVEATGWQSHTVRGTLAGALKKKLGLTIVSAKIIGAERTYRIA